MLGLTQVLFPRLVSYTGAGNEAIYIAGGTSSYIFEPIWSGQWIQDLLSFNISPAKMELVRFPFSQTNNFEINGRNYLWPPELTTTAIKLINSGRLSVSVDCCVI